MRLTTVDYRQPVNRVHPLNRGRIGWWLPLPHRYGGPCLYDLVSGFPASLEGFTSGNGWTTFAPPGQIGSLSYAGSQYVQAFHSSYLNAATMTVAAWINCASASAGTLRMIATRDAASTGNREFQFRLNGNQVEFIAFIGGSAHTVTGVGSVGDNNWHWVAATFDGAYLKTWIDGALDNSLAQSGSIDTGAIDLYLGTYSVSPPSYAMTGHIAEASLWSRPLSAADMASYYRLCLQGYPGILHRPRPSLFPLVGAPTAPGVFIQRPLVRRSHFEPAHYE